MVLPGERGLNLFISRVYADKFRNLSSVLVDFNRDLNIILGANGQGKTNLLEAIYYLGTGRSHRTSVTGELIAEGFEDDGAIIQIKLIKNDDLEDKLSLRLKKNKKVYRLNDEEVDKQENFIGRLNVVMFSPEDLQLVKGSPSNRRDFLDIEVSQVSSSYYRHLQRYRRVLRQRNNLLKEIRSGKSEKKELLSVFTDQLVDAGSKIVAKRLEVVDKLKILGRLHQRRLTNNEENLTISYDFSFPASNDMDKKELRKAMERELEDKIEKEIDRGYTTCGPHRDDLNLILNEMNVRKYGSQGQQRTVALSLKLSELEFMKSEAGEYPVLLLDDVFSELDEDRRGLLMDFIGSRVQTFLTTTDRMMAEEITSDEDHFYTIRQGEITEGW